MRERDLRQVRDGHVVHDLLAVQDAAMSVRRVLAETDIRDDDEVGHVPLQRADSRLNSGVGIRCTGSGGVLLIRDPEEQHAGDAVYLCRRCFLHRFVHRELEHAWHRRDLAADAAALAHEQRIDEAVGRQARLAHEATNGLRSSKPPWPPRQGESGCSLYSHV